jgi:hypothetical protein
MKKVIAIVLAVVMLATLSGVALADKPADGEKGNGLPKVDTLYKMNIIGVPKGKTANMGDDNGKRIFVPLSGHSKIWLQEGPFDIIDANGTDNDGALFQLPAPEYEADGVTVSNTGVSEYSVFIRVLGKPMDDFSSLKSCQVDPGLDGILGTADDIESCSVAPYILELKRETGKGKTKAQNVTAELLYLWLDTDDDGEADTRVPLFADAGFGYWWDYDNNGLKVAQIWFMDISTNVGDPPDTVIE